MPDAASHPRMDGEAENAGRRRPEGICRHSVKSGSSEYCEGTPAWAAAAEAWGCFRVSGGRFRHGCHCAPPPQERQNRKHQQADWDFSLTGKIVRGCGA